MTQEDVRGQVFSILERGHLLSLATIDDGGPWVSDVVFVHDERCNIFWISNDAARHSVAILKNPQVAGTITISNKSKEPNECIQVAGTASKLEGEQPELAAKHLQKRLRPIPEGGAAALSEGQSWYTFTPLLIELIYEPLLGKGKKEKFAL